MKSLNNFAKKTLSNNELRIFNTLKESNKASYLAKQFAGKEAISKAFGTGFSKPVLIKDIEILRNEKGKPISGFILDNDPYSKSKILITGKNFGCGSSREHAPWALLDFGIE